jgi:hypothetical protein
LVQPNVAKSHRQIGEAIWDRVDDREAFELAVVKKVEDTTCDAKRQLPYPCPRHRGRMIIIETFALGRTILICS